MWKMQAEIDLQSYVNYRFNLSLSVRVPLLSAVVSLLFPPRVISKLAAAKILLHRCKQLAIERQRITRNTVTFSIGYWLRNCKARKVTF